MDEALLDLLHDDLHAADYTAGTVSGLLGSEADAARQRGVFAAARMALAQLSVPNPLATLIRLFLLGEKVGTRELNDAFPRLTAQGAEELGLVELDAEGFTAKLSLNPVQLPDPQGAFPDTTFDLWIVSDLDDQLRRDSARPDHVMGVGGATRSLIAQLPFGAYKPIPASSTCLDLGTGCGIVALFLARAGAKLVVATDISERALTIARANARLNSVQEQIEFRRGNLFAPVLGERFDYIASNPPFVITPRLDNESGERYEYRDGGMEGDALAEEVVREAPAFLLPGGTFVCLANWESPWGVNGLDRVRTWIESASGQAGALGAWVIERDRIEPARYAETWARDGGAKPGDPVFEQMMANWLKDFAERRVTAVGLGTIRIKKLDGDTWSGIDLDSNTSIRAEHVTEPLTKDGLGVLLEATFLNGLAVDRMRDEDILARRWLRTASVDEVREHEPGEEGPRAIWIRTGRPIQRTIVSDPLLAAAIGACDGELSLTQIADALATILEVDPVACAEALVDGVRELVWLGVLEPTLPQAAR